MKKKASYLLISVIAAMLASCSGLSKEAKEMVGDYYIPEISADKPLMELKSNGKCIIRAIKPNELTYEVPGKWNVRNDSLIAELKPEKMTWEGDSTLIGSISTRFARKVTDFNGLTLTLSKDGVNYVYFRRGHVD